MKSPTRLLSVAAALALSLVFLAGCSNQRRPNNLGSTSGTSPVGSNGTAPMTTGIVGQLTGDADDEVSAATQALVAQAVVLDENDLPLDF